MDDPDSFNVIIRLLLREIGDHSEWEKDKEGERKRQKEREGGEEKKRVKFIICFNWEKSKYIYQL